MADVKDLDKQCEIRLSNQPLHNCSLVRVDDF